MPRLSAKDQWIKDFFNAVYCEQPAVLAEMLTSKHADIDAIEDGASAIHTAVICKRKDNLVFLIQQKARVNGVFYRYRNTLNFAVLMDSVAMCKILLKAGADMYESETNHRSAAEEVFSTRGLNLGKLFIRYGLDVNALASIGSNGSTLLHRAAARGDMALVNLLLKNNANVLAVDLKGWTPSQLADQSDYREVANCLRQMEDKESDRLAMESSTITGKPVDKTKLERSL